MAAAKAFVDSNVILYLFSDEPDKAARAESLFDPESTVSVQVLNEVANVLRRKTKLSWQRTAEALELIGSLCRVVPVTIETHTKGLRIAQRYGLSLYDAMIVSAALLAECDVLFSEDMQHGLHVDRHLRIVNPFRVSHAR